MEDFAPIEQDIYWGQNNQIKYIESLERQLIVEGMKREISIEDLRKKLRGAVLKLDIGVNDENLDELCELVYLPRWSNLRKSQDPYIGATNEWIRNEEYITSLEKQIDDACSMNVMFPSHVMQYSSVHPN